MTRAYTQHFLSDQNLVLLMLDLSKLGQSHILMTTPPSLFLVLCHWHKDHAIKHRQGT